jgi:hypothetical protein
MLIKVTDFDDLYLRFSYVMGKDWEICSVSDGIN